MTPPAVPRRPEPSRPRPRRDRDARRRPARGFTLVELLIASALLAVLAVLSWRGLDAVLLARARIADASDELRALTLAFAQMDEDLRRSWPVRLLRLQPPSIGFTVSGEQAAATLELLREATGATQPTQLQRVAWRLRDGLLERGFGAWVPPQSSDPSASLSARAGFGADGTGGASGTGMPVDPAVAAGLPAGSLVWQPVLAGVASLQMQAWIPGRGWVAAESLAGQLRGPGAAAPGTGGEGTPSPGLPGGTVGAGAPGGGAGPTGTVGGGGASGVPRIGPTFIAVTGLQVRVVRTDGQVLQRVFAVRD